MMKLNSGRFWLKTIVYTLSGLMICWLVMLGVLKWQFDERAIRASLGNAFTAQQRTVHIEGKIQPIFWPLPGVAIEKITLSAVDSTETFATVQRLEAHLAWWPLLTQKRHVVQELSLSSIQAEISRNKQGEWNIQDLLKAAQQPDFEIRLDKFHLNAIDLSLQDALSNHQFRLRQGQIHLDNLKSDGQLSVRGQLENGENSVGLALDSPLRVADDQLAVDKFSLTLHGNQGDLGDARLDVEGAADINLVKNQMDLRDVVLRLDKKQNPTIQLEARTASLDINNAGFDTPRLDLNGQITTAGSHYLFNTEAQEVSVSSAGTAQAKTIRSNIEWRYGQHALKTQIDTALHISSLNNIRFEPVNLQTRFESPYLPRGEMKATLSGTMSADLKKDQLETHLEGKLDGEAFRFDGKQIGFDTPRHQVSAQIDLLDLNRYLPQAQAKTETTGALLQSERPLRLDWLAPLDITGDIAIGEMRAGRFALQNLNFHVNALPDRLTLSALKADIYEGHLSGSMQLVNKATPEIHLEQNLRQMNLHPLLRDVFDFSRLEGKGSGRLELSATGQTFSDLRRTLTGSIALTLNRGALTGIDLMAALKNLPGELQSWSEHPLNADKHQRTEFQRLNASFLFENGVGRNQDLHLNSTLLGVNGSGKLDLVNNIVDYTLETQVTSKVQTPLQALSVPIKITGAINAPTYALDFNRLVKDKKTEAEKQDALKEQLTQPLKALAPQP